MVSGSRGDHAPQLSSHKWIKKHQLPDGSAAEHLDVRPCAQHLVSVLTSAKEGARFFGRTYIGSRWFSRFSNLDVPHEVPGLKGIYYESVFKFEVVLSFAVMTNTGNGPPRTREMMLMENREGERGGRGEPRGRGQGRRGSGEGRGDGGRLEKRDAEHKHTDPERPK